MFREIAHALDGISKVSSRIDKERKVKVYGENIPGFKDTMKLLYDPYVRTNIGKAKLDKALGGSDKVTLDEILAHLTYTTGKKEDVEYAKTFVNQFKDDAVVLKYAKGLVTKNVKIGVTAKTLNKVFGENFIPLIGIMRAENYEDFKHKVKGPYIVTEKIDGVRRLLVKEDGVVTLYSRSGIPDDGLVDIEKEAKHLPDDSVYDGELKAIGEFNNALELRQATSSLANKKGERHGLTFNIFDVIPLHEFKKGKSTHHALTRKAFVAAMFKDPSLEFLTRQHKEATEKYGINFNFEFIQSVPIEGIAKTYDDVMLLTEPIWNRGFEGTMLNTVSGLYDITKTKSREILKVKRIHEDELQVVGVAEGINKNQGRVGALVCNYKGYNVEVGSGLTDHLRILFWNDPSKIIGKIIEIEHQGESKNKQNDAVSLNCPIFKRVKGEE